MVAAGIGTALAGCGAERLDPPLAAARLQATPTPAPSPSPSPTPAPTDVVTLRPVDGQRGSGEIEVDRASGWFTVRIEGMRRLGRRRAHALWVRTPRAGALCRLGFMVPLRDGAAEGSGQLPKLPRRTRFILSVERSANARRPAVVVLRGRSDFRIRSAVPRRRVCRR